MELAGKIQFINGNFSSHLKNLVSDRLNSKRGSEVTSGAAVSSSLQEPEIMCQSDTNNTNKL